MIACTARMDDHTLLLKDSSVTVLQPCEAPITIYIRFNKRRHLVKRRTSQPYRGFGKRTRFL